MFDTRRLASVFAWLCPLVVIAVAAVFAGFCSFVHGDLTDVSRSLARSSDLFSAVGRLMVMQPLARAQHDAVLPEFDAASEWNALGRNVPELEGDVVVFTQMLIEEGKELADVLIDGDDPMFEELTVPLAACGPHASEREVGLGVLLRSYLVEAKLMLEQTGSWQASTQGCSAMMTARKVTTAAELMAEKTLEAFTADDDSIQVADTRLLTLVCFVPLGMALVFGPFAIFRVSRLRADREDFARLFTSVKREDAKTAAERLATICPLSPDSDGAVGEVWPAASGARTSAAVGACAMAECALLLAIVLVASRTRATAGALAGELAVAQEQFVVACEVGAEAVRILVDDVASDFALMSSEIERLRTLGGAGANRYEEHCGFEVGDAAADFYECLSLEALVQFIVDTVHQDTARAAGQLAAPEVLVLVHAIAFTLDARVRESILDVGEGFDAALRGAFVTTWACFAAVALLAAIQFVVQRSDVQKVRREYETMRALLLRLPPFPFASNEAIMSHFLEFAGRDRGFDSYTTAPQVVFERDRHAFLVLNSEWMIESASPVTTELFDLQPSLLIGQSLKALVREGVPENTRLYNTLEMLRGDANAQSGELEIFGTRDDQAVVPLGVVAIALARGSGRVSNFGLIMRSIAVLKSSEAAAQSLKRSNDSLVQRLFPAGLMVKLPRGVRTLEVKRASMCSIQVTQLASLALAQTAAGFLGAYQHVCEAVDQASSVFPQQTRVRTVGDDFLFAAGLFLGDGAQLFPATDSLHLGLQILGRLQNLNMTLDQEFAGKVAIHLCGPVLVGLFGRRAVFDVVGEGLEALPRMLAACPVDTILLTKSASDAISAARAVAGIVPSELSVDGLEDLFQVARRGRGFAEPGQWKQKSIHDSFVSGKSAEDPGYEAPSLNVLLEGGDFTPDIF
jgi:hypothetical protein